MDRAMVLKAHWLQLRNKNEDQPEALNQHGRDWILELS